MSSNLENASLDRQNPRQGWATLDGVVALSLNRSATRDEGVTRDLIKETIARWGIAFDEGRLDVIASLFTKDAEFISLRGSDIPVAHVHDRDSIVAGVANARMQQADQRRHAISNVVIEHLAERNASIVAYGIITVANEGLLTLGASAIYTGDLVLEDDHVWRFRKFVIGVDLYAGRPVVSLSGV